MRPPVHQQQHRPQHLLQESGVRNRCDAFRAGAPGSAYLFAAKQLHAKTYWIAHTIARLTPATAISVKHRAHSGLADFRTNTFASNSWTIPPLFCSS